MRMTPTVPVLGFSPSLAPVREPAADIVPPRTWWLRRGLMDAVGAQIEKGQGGFIVNDVVYRELQLALADPMEI